MWPWLLSAAKVSTLRLYQQPSLPLKMHSAAQLDRRGYVPRVFRANSIMKSKGRCS